ncbi:DUF2238 domain-containing protein [Candidatus Pacearchaeota archaeon]|nr:DUF2238 domain-containing protein [Candidatus Pacearchaeota archaeon]
MKFKKSEWLLVIFNLIYIVAFSAYYISIKNYEFLIYILILVIIFALVLFTLRKSKFDNTILWGLSVWGLLHMAGGGIRIDGATLYSMKIIHLFNVGDTYVFKFDQFVHAFGFMVATLVGYHLLKPYLNEKTNYKVVYPLLIAIGMGLGALNEIAEFIAVLVVQSTGVGGYFNTLLDIVFNTIGAIIAVIIIHFRRKNK